MAWSSSALVVEANMPPHAYKTIDDAYSIVSDDWRIKWSQGVKHIWFIEKLFITAACSHQPAHLGFKGVWRRQD